MPVTFHPAPHKAKSIPGRLSTDHSTPIASPTDLLKRSCAQEAASCSKDTDGALQIIRSSFPSDPASGGIRASSNGFVWACIQAYNGHHKLVIRPDDVWLAILTQFSLYVNAHAEELRHHFVAHEGQKELEVEGGGSTNTYNWSLFPKKIARMIEENVKDPELRDWIEPSFSTTTEKDKVVCNIVMMSTLQHYFTYKCTLLCGIPSVTLQGEKSDWENILSRIQKLPSFGEEAENWTALLRPVVTRFVNAFDDPVSLANKGFWQNIAHRSGGGSGPTYLSGWLTAFCFWGNKGINLYQGMKKPPKCTDPAVSDDKGINVFRRGGRSHRNTYHLILDDQPYHTIDMSQIPPGFAGVPVTVDDNGYVYMARMVAGSVAIRATKSEEWKESGGEGEDTLAPEVGWWMFKVKDDGK